MAGSPIDKNRVTFLHERQAEADVKTYLSTYTGRHFERLGGGGDRPASRDSFTAEDIVAVSTLSVEVPPEAAVSILKTDAANLNSLLSLIPADVDLWDAGELVEAGHDANRLWDALRSYGGMGRVITSKLMARKRPRLVPVYDVVVGKVLRRPEREDFWVPLRDLLAAEAVIVTRLRELADLDPEKRITPLRAFDIATWMRGKREMGSQTPV